MIIYIILFWIWNVDKTSSPLSLSLGELRLFPQILSVWIAPKSRSMLLLMFAMNCQSPAEVNLKQNKCDLNDIWKCKSCIETLGRTNSPHAGHRISGPLHYRCWTCGGRQKCRAAGWVLSRMMMHRRRWRRLIVEQIGSNKFVSIKQLI